MLNTCSSVFVAWDQKEQKVWYYAIVLEGPEKGIKGQGRKAKKGSAFRQWSPGKNLQ